MSTKELGEHFDIHGGGLDLKFPHHENEIAQTCGATGGKFAEIWMHNGFLNIDNEKMSKSLGNFFTTRDVLAKIRHPEVLRFFLLSSHYRGPMNYSPEQLEQAEAGLNRLYTALRDVPEVGGELFAPTSTLQAFEAAMDDDFNTPEGDRGVAGTRERTQYRSHGRRRFAPGKATGRRVARVGQRAGNPQGGARTVVPRWRLGRRLERC